jgi:outer membrane protein OmpA-like peptidoglycan-associated protein/opacity protein-like surface antigen
MKKPLVLASLLLVLLSNNLLGQSTKHDWLHQSSWELGFGFSYPRYISTNLRGGDFGNYGLFLSIQKNFSEHVGFRIKENYLHIADRIRAFLGNQNPDFTYPKIQNDIFLTSFDLLYYFVPCEPVSPFAGMGVAGVVYKLKNSPIDVTETSGDSRPLDKTQIDYEFNAFLGAEWRVAENWKLKTEMGYHTAASSKFDGLYGTENGGLFGGFSDTYISFDLGVTYYFNYGEKSHICEIYDGISPKVEVQPTEVDYNKIEEIVKKYRCIPTPVVTPPVVTPPVPPVPKEKWVLVGVNFDFNKASLKPESITVLDKAVEILLKNPDVKVEIQGHTDNIGSDQHNQKLSLQRAETVKNYFIAKGIAANRLTTVGYGKSKPIMDNNTEQGRFLNRRIELKVIK